jgi:hypothetical protein
MSVVAQKVRATMPSAEVLERFLGVFKPWGWCNRDSLTWPHGIGLLSRLAKLQNNFSTVFPL